MKIKNLYQIIKKKLLLYKNKTRNFIIDFISPVAMM
jgi:hypothetical protein